MARRWAGPFCPEIMGWLWGDHEFSSDPKDPVERFFNVSKRIA
jgi:hypothetical protein